MHVCSTDLVLEISGVCQKQWTQANSYTPKFGDQPIGEQEIKIHDFWWPTNQRAGLSLLVTNQSESRKSKYTTFCDQPIREQEIKIHDYWWPTNRRAGNQNTLLFVTNQSESRKSKYTTFCHQPIGEQELVILCSLGVSIISAGICSILFIYCAEQTTGRKFHKM